MIDTHAHLTHRAYRRDLEAVLARAWEAGLQAIVVVGYDLESSRAAAALAGRDERLFAAVGIHPHDASAAGEAALAEIERLAANPRVVAIGETGLDFYRDLAPRERQEGAFRRHIDIARRAGLPLVVHDREAHEDVLRVLEDERVEGAVLHCFSGGPERGLRAAQMGCYVGIAGPVTYEAAAELAEVVRVVPRERLLLETDCPWLAPEPHRRQRNEPSYLRYAAASVASLWGISAEEASQSTAANARRAFPRLG